MRRRSLSYSPPRRGYSGRGRSPPRGRYSGRRDDPTSLLVRNIPRDFRAEELRIPFERFGPIKDVYLPKDYYTGGDVQGKKFLEDFQFMDPLDAAEAQYHMDHQFVGGREITVVFAEENRKKPEEMRIKGRIRRRPGYGRRGSPYYAHSRSPQYHSPPRRGHRSRSYSPALRRRHDQSISPSYGRGHDRSRSPSPRRDFQSPSMDPRRRHSSSSYHSHRQLSGSRSRSSDMLEREGFKRSPRERSISSG